MFTGLIQDVGTVAEVHPDSGGVRLAIATALASQLRPGDSVAVSGVCLTATAADGGGFEAEAMNETLALSSLSAIEVGVGVNLELAMRVSDRLGGHLVQGHVDGTAEVISISAEGIARRLRVALAPELKRYVVKKGSIALEGVSLTIATVASEWAEVSLVPETLKRTNLDQLSPGDRLNVECDIVAKYVERLLSPFGGKERA